MQFAPRLWGEYNDGPVAGVQGYHKDQMSSCLSSAYTAWCLVSAAPHPPNNCLFIKPSFASGPHEGLACRSEEGRQGLHPQKVQRG